MSILFSFKNINSRAPLTYSCMSKNISSDKPYRNTQRLQSDPARLNRYRHHLPQATHLHRLMSCSLYALSSKLLDMWVKDTKARQLPLSGYRLDHHEDNDAETTDTATRLHLPRISSTPLADLPTSLTATTISICGQRVYGGQSMAREY